MARGICGGQLSDRESANALMPMLSLHEIIGVWVVESSMH